MAFNFCFQRLLWKSFKLMILRLRKLFPMHRHPSFLLSLHASLGTLSEQPWPLLMFTSFNETLKLARVRVGVRQLRRPGLLSALEKLSFVHRWKYKFVYVKKMTEDKTIPAFNAHGSNKTLNKPCTTPSKKEVTTINYFWVINFVYP